jgi:uncharacterized protein (DUF4213/DUF364 family)
MTFANDYLAQLEAFCAVAPAPRIKALHLPPSRGDTGDNRGEFCAVELADGSLGLSYVLFDDTLARLAAASDDDALAGADALTLARGYVHGQGIHKTIGFAVANALTRCLFDRAGFVPDASIDSIGHLRPEAGEQIGMIGFFKPLLGRILDSGARLVVVELNSELAGMAEGYEVTLDATRLTQCTQVVSTSTLLLNDTLDRMLGYCHAARRFAMIGPSAGCLPDALFARGVTLLGGSWVLDRPAFLDALKSGEARGASARKVALTPQTWPGTAALMERLR